MFCNFLSNFFCGQQKIIHRQRWTTSIANIRCSLLRRFRNVRNVANAQFRARFQILVTVGGVAGVFKQYINWWCFWKNGHFCAGSPVQRCRDAQPPKKKDFFCGPKWPDFQNPKKPRKKKHVTKMTKIRHFRCFSRFVVFRVFRRFLRKKIEKTIPRRTFRGVVDVTLNSSRRQFIYCRRCKFFKTLRCFQKFSLNFSPPEKFSSQISASLAICPQIFS